MSKPKKTIKKRIFNSHILIIIISAILTSLVFNICLNIYLRTQTRSQLVSAGKLIQNSVNKELIGTNSQTTEKGESEVAKLLKVNKILRQTQTFLNIDYGIVGPRGNLVFPREKNAENDLLSTEILPEVKSKIKNKQNKNRVIYFKVENEKYAAIIHPIKDADGKQSGELILFSKLNNSRKITLVVNILLISVLLITSIIALIISNIVSKRISKPIDNLINYAEKIGDREYTKDGAKYEDDEIGKLAQSMESMAQKLGAYDNTMKTFLQNSSHELRTPLMSIQGYAEGVKFGVIEDKEGAVDVIIEESRRLSTIVEDLLYLSKIDSLQEELTAEELNVENLLRSCIERVNGIAIQSGIKIILNSKNSNVMIKGDEESLSRAIINIFGNCLRYAKDEIQVNLDKNSTEVSIIIKDNGGGFDSAELPNIFDRFFKGKGGNHGLGLAITKSIIEKHNGVISAENSIEGGACFKIVLKQ